MSWNNGHRILLQDESTGPNPINSLQACNLKDLTLSYEVIMKFLSHESFVIVFTKKFFKDMVHAQKVCKYT